MTVDLGADVGALVGALVGSDALLGVVVTVLVLLVADWRPRRALPRHALAVPMLVAVTTTGLGLRVGALSGAVLVVTAVVVVSAALLAGTAPQLRRPSLMVPLMTVTAAGLFAGLPETGGSITLLAGMLTLLLLDVTGARRLAPSGSSLAGVVVGVGLLAAADGIRPGQIVGGVGCIGVIAVIALFVRLPWLGEVISTALADGVGRAIAVTGQVGVVVVVSRGPGIRPALEVVGYLAPLAIALVTITALAHHGAARGEAGRP